MLLEQTGRAMTRAEPRHAALPDGEQASVTNPTDLAINGHIDTAIARLGGNTALYSQLLTTYLKELAGLPDQLDALLDSADADGTARLLHTLKGVSGTVGAQQLALTAQSAEISVQSSTTIEKNPDWLVNFRQSVDQTQQIFESVAKHYSSKLPAARPSRDALSDTDKVMLQTTLHALLALLKGNDMHAIEAHATVRQLHLAGDEELLSRLDDAMSRLDFAHSADLCKALLDRLASHRE